jgi:hypothetical protein
MTARVLTLFPWPQLSADNFDAFWQMYPRRVAKLDAQRAWAKLNAQDRAEVLRRLPLFIDYWRLTRSSKQFVLHPASFLNGRRWEDEIEGDAAPMVDYGQCEWNKNGTRDPAAGRCADRAHHESPQGHHYCERHAASLGLLLRRKA